MSVFRARVAIIGAGASGLACGQRLREWGFDVVLFDKSRGPGGRVCTRRRESDRFDHGAQYFTVSDPDFERDVKRWVSAGAVAEWEGRFGSWSAGASSQGDARRARWVGQPRMSALPRAAAEGLEVRLESRVISLDREGEEWIVTDDKGVISAGFDWVVVTCPGPQAQPLIPESSPLYSVAADLAYHACWAAMISFEEPVAWPYDGVRLDHPVLAWAARDSSKPGRAAGERWVLHAQPEWSLANVDETPEEVAELMVEALRDVTGSLPNVRDCAAHRWLYARSSETALEAVSIDTERQLGLCGDGASGSRLEQAWLSGIEMARCIAKV